MKRNPVKRCAVAKIDLKGRFVYIDDQAETLLGDTGVNLFGKLFLDYLDEASKAIVRELTSCRNHYESYYDATHVTIVGSHKKPVEVILIISLSFIAGNPVNYLLIMTPADGPSTGDQAATGDDAYQEFLSEAVPVEGQPDLKRLLGSMRSFVGAKLVCLYIVTDAAVEPRCVVGDDTQEFASVAIPDLGLVHRQVIKSGRPYDFTKHIAAPQNPAAKSTRPLEYAVRLEVGDSARYLLRFVFDEHREYHDARALSRRASAASRLTRGVLALIRGQVDDNQNPDLELAVGLLDELRVGAAILDSQGVIIGYNPTLKGMLPTAAVIRNYHDLADSLASFGEPGRIAEVLSQPAAQQNQSPLELTDTDGQRITLTVVRFSDAEDDLSGCVALLPAGSAGRDDYSERAAYWRFTLASILCPLESGQAQADKVRRRPGKSVPPDKVSVSKIVASVDEAVDLVQRFIAYEDLARYQEPPEETDLKRLAADAYKQAGADHPDLSLTVRFGALPTIVTQRRKLRAVARILFGVSMRLNANGETTVKIQAQIDDKTCRLTLLHDHAAISARVLKSLGSNHGSTPAAGSGRGAVMAGEVARARYLAGSMGASMTILPGEKKKQVVMEIMIPTQEPTGDLTRSAASSLSAEEAGSGTAPTTVTPNVR